MLQEVFYWVFNMSITAVITGVLIMLIRLAKRIPRRLTVFLWIVPFLRMTFPFGLNSPYSLMSLLSQITTKTIIVYQPTDDVAFSMMNSIMGISQKNQQIKEAMLDSDGYSRDVPFRASYVHIEW